MKIFKLSGKVTSPDVERKSRQLPDTFLTDNFIARIYIIYCTYYIVKYIAQILACHVDSPTEYTASIETPLNNGYIDTLYINFNTF